MICIRKSLPVVLLLSSCMILFVFYLKYEIYFQQFAEMKTPRERLKMNPKAVYDKAVIDRRNSDRLRVKIKILRDALLKAHSHPLATATEPTCKGNRLKGEVEDLLCMDRPKYLTGVRNPCWWDRADKLRCLPFFHLLGVHKSATTDLWHGIASHPDILKGNKEIRFWGKYRYGLRSQRGKPMSFKDYTNFFENLSSIVKSSLQTGGSKHRTLIMGDGTPTDMTELRGWSQLPQNRGRKLPYVLTPHLMKHLYPDTTKFIVILRNPIERMYSRFMALSRSSIASKTFHESVLEDIDMMAHCVQARSLVECFYDAKYFFAFPTDLPVIDYSLYIKEWLKVFPRDRFLFLKTEEYKKDLEGTVRKCWEFLGLNYIWTGVFLLNARLEVQDAKDGMAVLIGIARNLVKRKQYFSNKLKASIK